MNIKGKRILIISCGAIFAAIFVVAVRFISDNKYRDQLPGFPDMQSLPKPLLEQISAAGKKTKRNPSANNLGSLGMVYHSSTYYNEAARCYSLAVQKNRNKWIWSYYLGYLNMELGESKKAIKNFRNVIEKNPGNNLAWYYTGEAYQSIGKADSAEIYFNRIASGKDQDFDVKKSIRNNYFPLRTFAMFDLARIYLNSNRLDNAEKTLKEVIHDQIKFGPAYRLLGNVYSLKGDSSLSNHYIIRAKDLSEFTPPLVDLLADSLLLMSRSDKFLMKEIDIATLSNNLKWALKLCNNALVYYPDNKFIISKVIGVNLSIGNGKQALSLLDRHFRYFENDYNELMGFASLLYEKGFPSEALRYFSAAKKLKPLNPYLPQWLGKIGYFKEAITLLNEQLESDPDNIDFLSNAVLIYLNTGEKEKVKQYLAKLKRFYPSSPGVKKFTGVIAEQEGNMKEAIAMYEEVFKDDPKNLPIIKGLGNFYTGEKMWDKAFNLFKQALDNNPNEPWLLDELGKLLLFCPDQKLRNINDGREYAERAYINVNSNYKIRLSAAKNLATAYAELGDKQKAGIYVNIAINLAREGNLAPDYLPYFETLKKQYNLPD